jgi:hypothetical protein
MANKPTIRVFIGIGCQSEVKAKTLASVAGVLIKSAGKVTTFSMRQGGDIVSARTWLVKEALKHDATHLLFVDSDMEFPPDALEKMLAHNKDIVGVEYFKRKLPIEPVFEPIETTSETEIYKAGFVGTGLVLINLNVFTSDIRPLAEPWFNFGRNSEGELVLGEDVWFCNTARDAGFEVWIDPTIEVGHVGDFTYKKTSP